MRDSEYNIALQDRYDELIHYSKDIWGESAAGGFSKKKFDQPLLRSPDKHTTKDISKKDGGGAPGQSMPNSIKKSNVVKMTSMVI